MMDCLVNPIRVQATNDESIVSKCSTVRNFYIDDEFIQYVVSTKKKRAPLIHLGYYTRMSIIERLIHIIVASSAKELGKLQIISCGAGFDTLFWRLSKNYKTDNWTLIEIDFPSIICRKLANIKDSPQLSSFVYNVECRTNELVTLSNNYHLIGCDLSNLDQLELYLNQCTFMETPTLVLSECVVTYMKKDDSDALFSYFNKKYSNIAVINYEQIKPNDGYGKVMIKHFDSLHSPLKSLEFYKTCEDHTQRFLTLGYKSSYSIDEWSLLNKISTDNILETFGKEQFDEIEEFHSKCTHYVIALAGHGLMEDCWSSLRIQPNIPCSEHSTCLSASVKEGGVQIYGHSTVLRSDDILIFGGVTSSGRSSSVFSLSQSLEKSIAVRQLNEYEKLAMNSTHASAVYVSLASNDFVIFYGGRTSPHQVWMSGNLIVLNLASGIVESVSVSGKPTPRYRSSLVLFNSCNSEANLYMFGGRPTKIGKEFPQLGDLWQLTMTRETEMLSASWREIRIDREKPSARMSHGLVTSDTFLYLSCGLDSSSYNALNDLWKFDVEKEKWYKLPSSHLTPRYGHTSHVVDNRLFLIGGVTTSSIDLPMVVIVTLQDQLLVREYHVQVPDPVIFIPFNHTSVVIGEKEILIIGGGGNCFSFGTHLNRHYLSIPVSF